MLGGGRELRLVDNQRIVCKIRGVIKEVVWSCFETPENFSYRRAAVTRKSCVPHCGGDG